MVSEQGRNSGPALTLISAVLYSDDMTLTGEVKPALRVEGPMRQERWGSVGFRLDDRTSPRQCREVARKMLTTFQLTWVPGLVDDVMTIVSELVTNACLYGGDSFPAGSLTMWHPNTRLIICVHDKNPEQPTRALRRAYTALREQDDLRHAAYVAGRPFEEVSAWSHDFDMETSGRGIRMITRLARNHLGELDYATDGDASHPGKVARVNLLLPNVMWRNRFTDPWTGHSKGPARQSRA